MIIGQSRKFSVGGGGANAAAFLARTSGLDGTHTTAYTNLINGLDTDGLFSKLDVLHIYATQDSTTALLNLVSTSFNGTAHGAPTFTADLGFTGVNASTTVYIDTGFNPLSGSPQFTQNSAHVSEWNTTNAQSAFAGVGSLDGPNTTVTYQLARYTDDNYYGHVNGSYNIGQNTGNSDSRGHYTASRTLSSSYQMAKNGSVVLTPANTSVALVNQNFYSLGFNFGGTANGVGRQVAAISIGGGLSATDITNFYTRLRTYMTAVGVP